MEQVRLAVVEDNGKYAAALVKALGRAPGIDLVGTYGSAEAFLAAVDALDPDVALLDIGLPGMDGIALVRALRGRRAGTELLMLTAFEDEERLFAALKAGASGYLTKQSPLPAIAQAVHDVAAGGTVISPALARRFCNHFASLGAPASVDDRWELEPQERELLTYLARGLTNSEAGRVMDLPRRTVRTILGHVYRKMGTNSRVEAVTLAIRAGVISL
jgi:DNA-binding NarL/FixJ family response regulator